MDEDTICMVYIRHILPGIYQKSGFQMILCHICLHILAYNFAYFAYFAYSNMKNMQNIDLAVLFCILFLHIGACICHWQICKNMQKICKTFKLLILYAKYCKSYILHILHIHAPPSLLMYTGFQVSSHGLTVTVTILMLETLQVPSPSPF